MSVLLLIAVQLQSVDVDCVAFAVVPNASFGSRTARVASLFWWAYVLQSGTSKAVGKGKHRVNPQTFKNFRSQNPSITRQSNDGI